MGFLQFFGPTTGFFLGLWLGEPLKFGQIVSFGFIWAGAVVFMWGVFTVSRRAASAPR
jgi:chloramphenicol-sensitive protein RarD